VVWSAALIVPFIGSRGCVILSRSDDRRTAGPALCNVLETGRAVLEGLEYSPGGLAQHRPAHGPPDLNVGKDELEVELPEIVAARHPSTSLTKGA
jgi:hypothetical protein